MERASAPTFWFERLYRGLRIPLWLGVPALSFVLPLLLIIDFYSTAGVYSNTNTLIRFGSFYFTLGFYMQLAAVYMGHLSEKVMDLAEEMGSGSTDRMRNILHSTRWTLVTCIPVEGLIWLNYLTSLGHSPSPIDIIADNMIPLTFVVLVSFSVFWAFFYSMISLYSLGRANLTLKLFAEDRTLGLRPFGTAALRLVAIYEIGVLIGAIPAIASSNFSFAAGINGIPVYIVFALLGLIFFFLPLLSFRGQLKRAKAQEFSWIGPRYSALVRALKAGDGIHVDERVVGSLSALDKVQRDIQQIHTWPFDAGIMTRLMSITILPLIVTVLGREVILLTLHL